MDEEKGPSTSTSNDAPSELSGDSATHLTTEAAPLEDRNLNPATNSLGANGASTHGESGRRRRVWVGEPPAESITTFAVPEATVSEAPITATPSDEALVAEDAPALPPPTINLITTYAAPVEAVPALQPEVEPEAPALKLSRERKLKLPTFPRWMEVAWSHRGIWLGLAAIVVGAYGQAALFQEERRPLAWWLLTGAMALAAVGWSGHRDVALLTPTLEPRRRFLQLVKWRRGLALRLAGIALSLALLWGSFQAWYAKPSETFGLQGYLWLASMATLLISCARWYPTGKGVERLEPRWSKREALVFTFLLVVSLVTRLAWLEEFPWRIDPNEWLAWNESIKFMQEPHSMSVFTTTWLDTGLPSMYFWFEAIPMRFFGDGLVWVRFLTAFLGAIFFIPVYLLARFLWGRVAAIVAATLIVGSSTLIQHTRMTNNNISTTIMWTFCFYFMLRGMRSRRPGDFVWAGLFAGTSMYTYYGTRLLPYMLAAFLGYMLVFHFRAMRERIGHFALMAIALVVGFGPLIAYFTWNPEKWAGRGIYEMIIPPVIPTTWELIVSDWNVVSRELVKNFLSLSVIPARDTFYWAPFFRPLEAVLLAVGGGVLIWRWRQPASFLILLWGFSIMLVASIIDIPINPNPNFPHWSPAWTVPFLMLALPLALWLQSLRRLKWRRWWWGGCVIVGVIVSWIAVTNLHFTFVTYPKTVPTDQSHRAVQARFLAQVKPNTLVRYVGCCTFDYEYGRAFARNTSVGQFSNASRQLPLIGDAENNQIFYVPGWPNPYVPILQHYYPGGRTENLTGPDGAYAATIYSIDAGYLMSRYGVQALVTDVTGQTMLGNSKVVNVGVLPTGNAAYNYPVVATWSGSFYVNTAGPVQLRVDGAEAAAWVMSQPGALNRPLNLDAGWVPFVIKARLDSPTQVLRLLKTESSIESEITTPYLWPEGANMGLAVTLGNSTATRVDQFVGSTAIRPDPNYLQPGRLPIDQAYQLFRPLSLTPQFPNGDALGRWSGELYVEGGTYPMELHVDGPVQLIIDDVPIINNCSPFPGGAALGGAATLTPGWHRVELRLQTNGPGGGLVPRGLEWIWTRPDGVREIVPPTRLRYSPSMMPDAPIAWPPPPGPVTCGP